MQTKHLSNNGDYRELLKYIYETKDEDGLWLFIKETFGIEISRVSICPDHDAPFDFIRDIFFQLVQNAILVSNRTGGKTMSFAVLDVLNSYLWDDCETATIGAIEEQAKKCYGYVKDWVNKIPIFNEMLEESLMSKTTFKNGSMVQILTGTMAGVNSPHPQKAFFDEIELMAWQILQEGSSMPQSRGEIKAQLIVTSTRKFAFGPMERLLDEAEERGFKVYRCCVMETIEPHDKEICRNSVFHEDCQQRCDQMAGHLQFNDVIATKKRLDADTWDSQWMSKKPGATALVYPHYNKLIHVRDIEPDLGAPLYLAEDFGFAEGHADVIGFFQEFSGKVKMIDEIWVEGKTDEELVDLVELKLIELGFIPSRYIEKPKDDMDKKRLLNAAVAAWYCPIEEPSKISIRSSRGYRVIAEGNPDRRRLTYGIPILRKAFQDMDENGEPMIVFNSKIAKRKQSTLREMPKYANKIRADGTILDEPKKINDNGPDMVRYFYINHLPIEKGGNLSDMNNTRTETRPITAGIASMDF